MWFIQDLSLWFRNKNYQLILLLLEMYDFDMTLIMKWLAKYDAVIDCFAKIVTVKKSGDLKFFFSFKEKGRYGHLVLFS